MADTHCNTAPNTNTPTDVHTKANPDAHETPGGAVKRDGQAGTAGSRENRDR